MLAKNRVVKVGGKTLYYRAYPQRGLTAHVVGYSTIRRSQAGLERSFNDYLTGANGNLSSVFRSTFDRWRGVTVHRATTYTRRSTRRRRRWRSTRSRASAAPSSRSTRARARCS